MKQAILGKKIGMTQLFREDGTMIPVTVVLAGPCPVTQVKTVEHDGYDAVQMAFQPVREKLITKPQMGHLRKAGVEAHRYVKEFKLDDCAKYAVGDVIKADTFAFPGIMFVMLMFLSLFGTHGKQLILFKQKEPKDV